MSIVLVPGTELGTSHSAGRCSTEWVHLSAAKIFYFLAMDIDNTLYNNEKKNHNQCTARIISKGPS